ncbi:MAG: hypothetical protein J0H99_16970, partial [Rhodospirillales bacterium]|nr:hypothetical protein [Rhodospirillales bacterium]
MRVRGVDQHEVAAAMGRVLLRPADGVMDGGDEERVVPQQVRQVGRGHVGDDAGVQAERLGDPGDERRVDQAADGVGGRVDDVAARLGAAARQVEDRHHTAGARGQHHLEARHAAAMQRPGRVFVEIGRARVAPARVAAQRGLPFRDDGGREVGGFPLAEIRYLHAAPIARARRG